jgi:hypothetical protein
MKRLFALILMTALPAGAHAVTPQQAQTLPTAELARVVLGEAGQAVVRVERPQWRTCRGLCPPLSPADIEARKGPPPLTQGLTFYQRPTSVTAYGSEWVGLCRSTVIGVHYGADDKVTGLVTYTRYAVPDRIVKGPGYDPKSDPAKRQAQADQKCADGWTPQSEFSADSEISALRVTLAATLFAQMASQAHVVGIHVECSDFRGLCPSKDQNQRVAASLAANRIRYVEQVSCTARQEPVSSFAPHGCYTVRLADDGETAFLDVTETQSGLKLQRIAYSRAMVLY